MRPDPTPGSPVLSHVPLCTILRLVQVPTADTPLPTNPLPPVPAQHSPAKGWHSQAMGGGWPGRISLRAQEGVAEPERPPKPLANSSWPGQGQREEADKGLVVPVQPSWMPGSSLRLSRPFQLLPSSCPDRRTRERGVLAGGPGVSLRPAAPSSSSTAPSEGACSLWAGDESSSHQGLLAGGPGARSLQLPLRAGGCVFGQGPAQHSWGLRNPLRSASGLLPIPLAQGRLGP